MDSKTISLAGKRVAVTGGGGFLGSFVVEKLRAKEVAEIFVPRRQSYDLTQREAAAQLYADFRPDVVIHLAATVGGIGANRNNPGRFFYENMAMGLHVMDEARRYGRLAKLVVAGTTCSYPRDTPTPFCEEDLWNGYPEETNAPYGIAKRALLVMLQGYRRQYGLEGIYLIPANLFGPRDNFDPETSHVIPGLIRKFVEGRQNQLASVTVWGTGQASREFLYVEDAAEGIILATTHYRRPEPINLGTGAEILIKDLVTEIAGLVGYQGEIRWDRSQPDGQPRRQLNTEKALEAFGFRAKTDLRTGLANTLAWYLESSMKNSLQVHQY
ncbi:MAG TPA: GDP-L-fucose synthase [Candidatus Acidoferrales bacterium]|nr:GDP-L-fucose synthase [Candidatus Acidoferrales bacterium]